MPSVAKGLRSLGTWSKAQVSAVPDMPSNDVSCGPKQSSIATSISRTASSEEGTIRAVAVSRGSGCTSRIACVTMPSRPLVPDEQLLRVETGIVLADAIHQIEDGAVPGNDLEAEHVAPDIPVADEPRTTGIRRDHAADGGSAPRSIGNHRPDPFSASLSAESRVPAETRTDRFTALSSRLPVSRSRLSTPCRPLASGVDAPDEAGIGALGDETDAMLRADPHRKRNLGRGRGPRHERGPAGAISGADFIAGTVFGGGVDAGGAEPGCQSRHAAFEVGGCSAFRFHCAGTTGLTSVPTPLISTSTTSPGFM